MLLGLPFSFEQLALDSLNLDDRSELTGESLRLPHYWLLSETTISQKRFVSLYAPLLSRATARPLKWLVMPLDMQMPLDNLLASLIS